MRLLEAHLLHNLLGDLDRKLAHARAAELLYDPIPSTGQVPFGHVRSCVAEHAVYEI